MARKSEGDKVIEARIRAHVRQQMEERRADKAEVARLTGINDGHLGRILDGTRGIGFTTLLKLCKGLKITPTRILESNPPSRFWDIDKLPREGGSAP